MGAWTEYTTTSLSVTFPHSGSAGDTLNAEVRTETTGGDSAYSATTGTVPLTIIVWSPGNAVTPWVRSRPGSGSPLGVTWDGTQLIVVDNTGDGLWTLADDELWTVADITQPGNAVTPWFASRPG